MPAFAASVITPYLDSDGGQRKPKHGFVQHLDDARIIKAVGILARPDFHARFCIEPSHGVHPLREADNIVADSSRGYPDSGLREAALEDAETRYSDPDGHD